MLSRSGNRLAGVLSWDLRGRDNKDQRMERRTTVRGKRRGKTEANWDIELYKKREVATKSTLRKNKERRGKRRVKRR